MVVQERVEHESYELKKEKANRMNPECSYFSPESHALEGKGRGPTHEFGKLGGYLTIITQSSVVIIRVTEVCFIFAVISEYTGQLCFWTKDHIQSQQEVKFLTGSCTSALCH